MNGSNERGHISEGPIDNKLNQMKNGEASSASCSGDKLVDLKKLKHSLDGSGQTKAMQDELKNCMESNKVSASIRQEIHRVLTSTDNLAGLSFHNLIIQMAKNQGMKLGPSEPVNINIEQSLKVYTEAPGVIQRIRDMETNERLRERWTRNIMQHVRASDKT